MKYHFKIHKEANGFWAECLEIPSCMTQGDSKDDLLENMQDAINTYLEEPEGVSCLAPLPDESYVSSKSIAEVSVNPEIALGFMVRYHRIKKGMTQKEAAEKLNMPNVFSYQRLERKCNATVAVLSKLLVLFPMLSINKIFE
jgi:predicted RNase H-like HicB family nuclease